MEINPGNFSGLAALAGSRTGGLGLAVPHPHSQSDDLMGGLAQGLHAMMGSRERKAESAKSDARYERAYADQRSDKAEASAFKQKQLDSIDQFRKDQIDEKEQQQRIVDHVNMDKEKRNGRAASAASTYVALENAKTPEEQSMVLTQSRDDALDKGLISKDEHDKLSKMNPIQAKMSLVNELMLTDKVNSIKQFLPTKAKNGTASTGGTSTQDVTPGNLATSKKTTDAAQQDTVDANDSLNSLDNMMKDYSKSYVGMSGKLNNAVLSARDSASGLPLIGDKVALAPEQKDWLKKRAGFGAASQELSLKIIKQLSGLSYTDKQLEFLQQITPNVDHDADTAFQGKADALASRLRSTQGIKEDLLKKGLKFGSDEYKSAWLDAAKSKVMAEPSASTNKQMTEEDAIKAGYSPEQIQRAKARLQGAQ